MSSEVKALILNENLTGICFDKKMANTGAKYLLLTTTLYINPNYVVILVLDKENMERKASMDSEGMNINKQEQKNPNNY